MQILGLTLKTAITLVVFATGLGATPIDLGWLWRRPALLLKSLLAMYVVVPIAAIMMVRALDLPRGTAIAIMVLAISAGAPLLPRKLLKYGGDPQFVVSLVVTTSLLAIVAVPAWLYAFRSWFGVDSSIAPSDIARVLAKTFLVPFGVGMLLRTFLPGADKAAEVLMKLGMVALLICVLILIFGLRHELAAVGMPSYLALAGFALMAILTGHIFGGPDPGYRTSLAVSCATRHIGLALLIASSTPSASVLALVIAYALATALVVIPYVKLRGRSNAPALAAT